MKLADLWRASLARRLVLLAALWSVPVLVVTGVAQTTFFHIAALNRYDDDLLDVANGLYAGSTIDDQGQVDAPPLTDARATRAYSGKYWQIAELAPGKLHALQRSRSLWDGELKGPPDGESALGASAGKPVYYDTIGPAREPLRAVALLAHLPGRTAPVVFMAAADRRPVDSDANQFALETFVALVVVGLGLIFALFIQVRVGLLPLFALRREVAAVRTGKSDHLVGRYPTELRPLAEELNALVAHDREVVERQRTHVGNLAHALKTPLSVLLAEARGQPGALAEMVTRQADAMRGHVDHHLRRARAAARAQGQRERTPVAPVLEELTLTLERIFRGENMEIDWRADDDLCFQGEKHDFMEMVGNLLENACKFSRGRVRVAAEPAGADRLTVTIEDNGAGLSAAQRNEVIKRGARLDETAPGSGLGLSIVDDLARAYGGALSLGDAAQGGLKVTLELPRAES